MYFYYFLIFYLENLIHEHCINITPSIFLHILHLPILDLFLIIVICTYTHRYTHRETHVCVCECVRASRSTHVHRSMYNLLNQFSFVNMYMCQDLTTWVWTTYVGAHPWRKPILPLSRHWLLKIWNFTWPGQCNY